MQNILLQGEWLPELYASMSVAMARLSEVHMCVYIHVLQVAFICTGLHVLGLV